jgi:hypothetical protein
MAEIHPMTTDVKIVTSLGVAILVLCGATGSEQAWLNLLLVFVLWFGSFDWLRGIRPTDRVHGMLT